MGKRRTGRFRLGRRRAGDGAPEADVPCIPCGQQAALRPFTLNEDDAVFDDDLVPTLTPEVTYAIAGGDVVLFDPRRSISTLLNSSAALVWASIDGTASVGSIIDELAAETGTDRATIDADVREAVARFVHAGIVEPPGIDATRPLATDASEPEPDRREQRRDALTHRVLARRTWVFADRRRCAGAAVEIRTDSVELAARLEPALALLPPSDTATTTVSITDRGPGSARRFRILRGSTTDAFAGSADVAFDTLFTLLNDIAINDSPGRLVLHAGAVERDGSVVVVAGPSGRGKSTLTAALVQRGFDYLTDEVVAIDPDTSEVLPYPKPLDLDRSSADLLGIDPTRTDGVKGKVAVAGLGNVGTATGRVRLLVLLTDPANPTPNPTPAEVLVELLANTFASTFDPRTGPADPLESLSTFAQRTSILHLDRTSVDEACGAIDQHLRSIDLAPTP